MSIKPLSKEHVEAMAKLHEIAFHSGWSSDDFLCNCDNEYDDILGVFDGQQLQGFILIRTQADQSEVLTIVVADKVRGQGLGKQILQAAESAALTRGATIMFLEVAKDNPFAIAFYKSSGYLRYGTRKAYYRREKGRVDALLFQKKLT